MSSTEQDSTATKLAAQGPLMAFGWLWVGVPFVYGVYSLLVKIPALFTS